MKKVKQMLGLLVMLLLVSACASERVVYVPKQYGPGSVVAVWDLEDLSIIENPVLADMKDFLELTIIDTLREKGGYEMIERQKLVLVLEELNLGSSDLADESSRLEVGKILGAQLMVFGGYQLVADELRVDLRMVEVESGAVIKADEVTRKSADMDGWLKTAEEAAVMLVETKEVSD